MAKEKKRMPGAGQAGLVRYFDEEETGPRFDPKHVVVGASLLVFIVLAMRVYAG